jgi:hypothetical protein
MDIENLNVSKPKTESKGLLAKTKSEMRSGADYSNPAVRVGMQMKVIRGYREQNSNDTV